MADETLTGAKTEVVIDKEATADRKKKIIKYVIIGLALVGGYILVRKFILKK
jgi:hypothetical protein